jgi:homoserine dehydrogenase
MKPINVGLLGIGTVGGGTWAVLARNQEEISRRAGREIRISVVADKEVEKAKKLVAGSARVTADAFEVVRDPDVDIVIELIGGTTVAKELVLAAIDKGKHVVTANKALLATHGNEIFAAAQKKGVIAFEGGRGQHSIIKALARGSPPTATSGSPGSSTDLQLHPLEMRSRRPFDAGLKESAEVVSLRRESGPDLDTGVDAGHKPSHHHGGTPASRVFDKCQGRHLDHPGRHPLRRAAWLPQLKLGITKRTERGIELGTPDADSGQAPDRQRRGRQRGAGKTGRRDDATARARAPSPPEARWSPTCRHHAAAHRRPAARAAPRSSPTACRA